MAADRDAGVDPRFDPVFQRGYDPAKHGGRRPRATARHATGPMPVSPVREPAVTPEAMAEPATAAATRSESRAPHPDAVSSDAGLREAGVESGDGPEHEDEPEPRGRNPFQLALLLVSIVAAGGSVWLYWRRFQEDPYGGSGYSQTPNDLFFYQIVDALMAPLLTGALVGFCLWLVLWAIRPRGPHGG
jgi:hypothetical protein